MGRMYGYGDSATFPPVGTFGGFDPRNDTAFEDSLKHERAEQTVNNPAELSALFGFDKLSADMHGLGDMDALETALTIMQHWRAGRYDMARDLDSEWMDKLRTEIVERGLT